MLSWLFFIMIVLSLLAFDLGVFHKENREMSFKESLMLSFFYVFIAILFGLWIWSSRGVDSFAEYMTGFLIEKTLALDNIFLISLVFSSLSIPPIYQHRVLFWGILGVLILRAIMIGLGAHLIARFSWILYVFAVIMILTGIKIFFVPHQHIDISQNKVLIWMRKYLNLTDKLHGEKFYIYESEPQTSRKKIVFTPLFIALVLIELIDLIFAIDSIPAIFSITQDPFIVYTSNIFAILGLRALYFALASLIPRFYYLKYALALVLIFIGSKIFIADALNLTKIPPLLSLGITLSLLSGGVVFSIWRTSQKDEQSGHSQ